MSAASAFRALFARRPGWSPLLTVSLRPDAHPTGELEELVVQILQASGSLPLARLADQVAKVQVTREWVWGWCADIGVWGVPLYRAEALTAIREMTHLLHVETE